MGFRFQKRTKLFSGLTLNFSKRGVSTSVGTRGARVNMGHGKARTTVSLPGTGISHTSTLTSKSSRSAGKRTSAGGGIVFLALLAALFYWLK